MHTYTSLPDFFVYCICLLYFLYSTIHFYACVFPAFGFCEFGNPDAALRAIRLLHDYEIAEKKLVVKADAKTKEVLDDYKGKRFWFASIRIKDTELCIFHE